jgi:hypothetical protein
MMVRSARTWLALAIGVALVAWMATRVPFDLIWLRARELPAWVWPGAMLGLFLTYVLRAGRLHAEWAGRVAPGFRECLTVTLVHNAAINLLPMRAGEASYPWLLHRRWGIPVAEAGLSLLWLRVQDALVLALAGIALLPWAPWPIRCALALLLAAAGALVAPQAVVRFRALLLRWAEPAMKADPPSLRAARWAPRWRRIADALGAGRGGAAAWGFCVANWSLKLLVVGALLNRLADLSLWAGVAGALAGELAAVLPVQAPAGIGTYEAGVWLGARSHTGLPAGEVLGAALVVHAMMLVLSWLCALILPLMRTPVGVAKETLS